MEKRAFERLSVNLQARLFYGNMVYSGIVTNLSEKGMFISTKMSFAVDSVFVTVVRLDEDSLMIPIKVRRMAKPKNYFNSYVKSGMGVELLNVPQDYLDYVCRCKSFHDDSIK